MTARPVVTGKATANGINLNSPVRAKTVRNPARFPATCQVRKPRQFGLSAAALKLALATMLKMVQPIVRAATKGKAEAVADPRPGSTRVRNMGPLLRGARQARISILYPGRGLGASTGPGRRHFCEVSRRTYWA